MTTENHYGKWVDSIIPITGVISNNSINQDFLNDMFDNAIDLTFENWIKENNPTEEEIENYESWDSDYLIGDWVKEDGLYMQDQNGEFSAIVRESVTQVIWSIHTKMCRLCSPCYPGQGDLDSEGQFLTFSLPLEFIGE